MNAVWSSPEIVHKIALESEPEQAYELFSQNPLYNQWLITRMAHYHELAMVVMPFRTEEMIRDCGEYYDWLMSNVDEFNDDLPPIIRIMQSIAPRNDRILKHNKNIPLVAIHFKIMRRFTKTRLHDTHPIGTTYISDTADKHELIVPYYVEHVRDREDKSIDRSTYRYKRRKGDMRPETIHISQAMVRLYWKGGNLNTTWRRPNKISTEGKIDMQRLFSGDVEYVLEICSDFIQRLSPEYLSMIHFNHVHLAIATQGMLDYVPD